jgi:hypothetical protein
MKDCRTNREYTYEKLWNFIHMVSYPKMGKDISEKEEEITYYDMIKLRLNIL